MQDELSKAIAMDLGISDLPEADQTKLIAQFGEVALKAASYAVLEKLSEEKRAEFMKIAQTGDPQSLQSFLAKELPDHETIARTAVLKEVEAFKAAQVA